MDASRMLGKSRIVPAMKVLERMWAQEYVNPFEGKNALSVQAFTNCREQGFSVSNFSKDRKVAFSENRNSDDIVVYWGAMSDFDHVNNCPKEKPVWDRARYFRYDAFDEAAKFILEYLAGVDDE